jgi:hypothetical protein
LTRCLPANPRLRVTAPAKFTCWARADADIRPRGLQFIPMKYATAKSGHRGVRYS